MKYILVILSALFFSGGAYPQLNCQVRIEAPQLPGTSDKQQLLDQMQKAVFEFMNNNNTWSKDLFTAQEKIDCSIFIDIISKLGTDEYMASIQVQSKRPVFKSSYTSTMFNYIDENFQFKFQQFSQLEFNINTFQNNLTSVLAFYAYVIIAEDYDSFSPLGGTEYWQKAQLIVNNAQTAAEKGWKSFEGNKNRYWLVENQLQPLFAGIRNCIYKYHRTGLDQMADKVEEGRANVLKSLELLVPVYQSRPASFNMELFFNAKTDELVTMFTGALPEEKSRAVEILLQVDPANTNKYLKIQGQ
ncbi:MAG: type IX secretion system protein PorD [Bacteroidia bacterium]